MENSELTSTRGVSKKIQTGRLYYQSSITVDGIRTNLGYYKTIKDAGMAYDLHIIKNNIKRPTNYLRKINKTNTFVK